VTKIRLAAKLASVVVGACLVAAPACSSSSNLTCGQGTVQQGDECVAAAPDATTGEGGPVGDGGTPAEAGAPTFAGVTAVAPASSTELFVTWNPATDPGGGLLRYRVYAAPASAPLAYTAPAAQTVPGARAVTVPGLVAGTEYVVGVRAVNQAGVEDQNTVTLKGTPLTDSARPTFAGVESAGAGGSGEVKLSWTAAQDDHTGAAAMTYLVYMSETKGGEDYTKPALVTAPGASSAIVPRLDKPTKPRFFVVRARDAAGNVDANTVEKSAAPGPDVVAPTFGGCTAAANVSALSLAVSWAVAADDVSDGDGITYDIFASQKPGKYDFAQPFATVKGLDSATIAGLQTATRYYFVCRARDEAGNADQNTVEVTAATGTNPNPPTFAGISSFVPDPVARTVNLSWAAATDDTTPTNEIVYDAYVATTAAGEEFTKPAFATSAAGATSMTLTGLTSNATLYFVVRARDQDGNHDGNTAQVSFTTNVSFALDIQPIFTHDCGVVGCHVPGSPTGGLILAPGFAYAQLVGVVAPELSGITLDGGVVYYADPASLSTSYLFIKTSASTFASVKAGLPAAQQPRMGTIMPATATGSTLSPAEVSAIASWIQQGAANN
jgi:Fibronectin type III domain